MDNKICERCNGVGTHLDILEKIVICNRCDGVGNFPPINVNEIVNAITTKRGGKQRFRSSPPASWQKSTRGVSNRRAYYVWRMARFHGGADITMPMNAELFCGHDPFIKGLNYLAEEVAKKVFGTDLAATKRWGRALGYTIPETNNDPPTAKEGGPVKWNFDLDKNS